jgi:hypothetical protein
VLRITGPSSSRGGHNKKLAEPEDESLRDYLLLCHFLGRSASCDHVVAAGNSILRCHAGWNKEPETCSRKWAKRWISRNHEFIKTLRSKPLSSLRRAAQLKEDVDGHFKEFRRCKDKWGILDEDVYNFDETGTQIGVIGAGQKVIVPANTEVVYVDDLDNRELVTSTECIGYSVSFVS